MAESAEERFPPSGSSRPLGIFSLVILAGFLGWSVVSSVSLVVILGTVVLAALVWAYNVRPSLRISGEHLVMRNPLQTIVVPIIAIEYVRITYYVVVRIGDQRFTCPAISRSRRKMTTPTPGMISGADAGPLGGEVYPDLVEAKIAQRARELRTSRGVELFTPEHEAYAAQVVRTWAWPEIAVLAVSAIALIVAVVLAG